ncbi:MAG: zinc ribbon domain-containing protein [Burkholderiales bacterium]|nr:zinc ribbon domain-containing protein [Burkholderiales bacterium]
MPIYAYRCAACGHAQDVLQKLSDPVLTVCPACGAAAYAKQVTAAGFQLKGSGWYVTDFKGGAPAAAQKDGDAAAAPADKGGEKGAEKGADKGDQPGKVDKGATQPDAAPAPAKAAAGAAAPVAPKAPAPPPSAGR